MNLITRIRKSYITRGVAMTLALNMLFEIIWPTTSMALTGGPSQPEVQSFEPVETTDMVNMFTGDFTYNIPLMYLPGPNGGYPINLAYHGGVTMDEEASWVGLGWNINAGALVRNVRGFADDANGDTLLTKVDMKSNVTVGLGVGANIEMFGADPEQAKIDQTLFLFGVGADQPSVGVNLGVRYNSYKGFGVNLGASFSPPAPSQGADWTFGLSLDSEVGLGANVSVSHNSKFFDDTRTGMGLSYGSEGMGLDFSRSKSVGTKDKGSYNVKVDSDGDMKRVSGGKSTISSSGSSSLGFSANTHMPMISYPVANNHVSISIKTGPGSLLGLYGNMNFSGYFNTQHLDILEKGKDVNKQMVGYENLESTKRTSAADYSRQKDGQLTKQMSNLAAPILTYDTYNIAGQGMNGFFRPFRTDVGCVFDPYMNSPTFGGSVAFDLSTNHLGYGGTITYGQDRSGRWEDKNEWASFTFKARDESLDGDYSYKDNERYYYRMHGDKSMFEVNELDFIGGESPIQSLYDTTMVLWWEKLNRLFVNNGIENKRNKSERISRNILIHKYTNADLEALFYGADLENLRDQEGLSGISDAAEMSIFFYDWSEGNNMWSPESESFDYSPDNLLNRQVRGTQANENRSIRHHNGGFKVLNEQGQYYVYGLPAYNNLEVESIFTVAGDGSEDPFKDIVDTLGDVKYKLNGTDKFIDKKTKAPYAHSYMLTSILGADYVDVDGNGASDNDLGYWVRFDYVKYSDDYKWRAPFNRANYDRGSTAHLDDDKGSYVYGEKEQWYLAKAETKTHVMVFSMSERLDMKEAAGEFENSGMGTQSGLRIDKISLFLKDEYQTNPTNAIALQEVHFEYDYSLCPGVLNNSTSGGKLTLKKVWFTYEGSGKGSMTPYQFVYDDTRNFTYDQFAYDRWGGYKKDGANSAENNFDNRFLPYVKQFDDTYSLDDDAFQAEKDSIAGAWGLSQIKLPSGGNIDVVYEADDYAYVQNETATQMFEISAVNDSTSQDFMLFRPNTSVGQNENNFDPPSTRRVYFNLENPLPDNWNNDAYANEIYNSYVKDLIVDERGNRNLYFKNYVNLRNSIWDYVSGYAPIEEGVNHQSGGVYLFGIDPDSDGGSVYTRGFITLQKQIKKIEHDEDTLGNFEITYHQKYHPMAMAAWQHMRLNDPLLLSAPAGIDLSIAADGEDQQKADAVASLLGMVPQTIQMFTGVWKYCQNNEFGRQIDLDKSVIRLCTPDKKKYGGGHRIKQVSISDNWDAFSGESESTYGVRYEYTKEEGGATISSGVAQYEPIHGGDEIALRYPKAYINNVPFNVDNSTYFEHPLNESYFPSPVVGYSKVTVKSINTDEQLRQPGEAANNSGIGTTGVTVYEFYTAKEYPIIVEETEIKKAHYNVPIPIPFIGKYERKKLTAIQGYKIELNDMHGQIKSIKKYGLNKDYQLNAEETSSIEYIYSDESYSYERDDEQITARRLNNKVNAISNELGIPTIEKRIIGVEYDFFTDQRQLRTFTVVIGANLNADLVPPVFPPIPGFWPAFSSSRTNLKTFVTNKIIFKSGILLETRTFDGNARVTTTNEVFDAQTGRPLIASVNNEFEDKIYNYSHPAHWEYDQMGGAYKNIDLVFDADIVEAGTLADQYSFETSDDVIAKLVSGDEFLIRTGSDGFIATYLGAAGSTTGIIHVEEVAEPKVTPFLSNTTLCEFKVIRSGRRNHVYADAGSIVSMQFPVNKLGYTVESDEIETNISETIGGAAFSFSDFNIHRMDKVLNASAVLFRDEWSQYDTIVSNPFKSGEAGIWRPYRSYIYVGARSAGASADERDLQTAGVMDSVELFNWQVPDFERYAENWQWTTEISRYNSEAYELENIDRLGIKSAALYCLKGSQVLGVGANGGYHEIGVEDFEDFTAGSTVQSHAKEAEGNLNFFNSNTESLNAGPVIRHYKIERGKSLTAGEFIIELNTTDQIDFNHQVKLDVQTNEFTTNVSTDKLFGKSFHIPCSVVDTNYTGGKLILELKSQIQFSTNYYTFMDANKLISGRVSVVLNTDRNPFPDGTFNNTKISFANTKFHTGEMSMKLDSGEYVFPQGKLDLIAGKSYVLSAWVSMANDKKVDFDDLQILPMEHDGSSWSSALIIGTYTKGKVVEGWQKIEMEFSMTDDIVGILVSNSSATGEDMFLDDIRISPKTGGIVTYVYNNHNMRLAAMLDNNNYASLYYYDEQGNLHLVKRETERGIQTVTENRGNNRQTNN